MGRSGEAIPPGQTSDFSSSCEVWAAWAAEELSPGLPLLNLRQEQITSQGPPQPLGE